MRRFGDSPKRGRSYKVRRGVYAVLLRGDEALLTFQSQPLPEVQLPGGGIDPGENPIRALHREVFEETGWSISSPRRLGIYRRFTYMPEYKLWAEKICEIWLARPILQLGDPVEPHHEAIWAKKDAALKLLSNSGDRFFFEQVC